MSPKKTASVVSPRPAMGTRLLVVLRSAGVGALATVSDLAVLVVLVSVFSVSARLASPVALLVGISLQFFGNKLIAFRDRSPRWISQAIKFVLVEAVGFALNLALYDALVVQWPAHFVILRMLTTAVVYFAVSLPLWSLIFARPQRAATAVAS